MGRKAFKVGADVTNRIRKIREDLGMTIPELGKAAGISKGYLSRLERGLVNDPHATIISAIANALHVEESELGFQPVRHTGTITRSPDIVITINIFLGTEKGEGA